MNVMSALNDFTKWLDRPWRIMFPTICIFIIFLLVAPLLIILPLSFSADKYFIFTRDMLSLKRSAFSLRWYNLILTEPAWRSALILSILTASASAVMTTAAGTLAAVGLWRQKLALEPAIMILIIAPTVTPIVVIASGIYVVFSVVGLTQTLTGLIIAHSMLSIPFMVATTRTSLSGFNRRLAHAGVSLGASPLVVFWRIMLPAISPGILSGAAFAFLSSFEELVVAMFLVTGEMRTLPKMMWSGARDELSPAILAAAVIMGGFSVVLALTAGAIGSRRRRSSDGSRYAAIRDNVEP